MHKNTKKSRERGPASTDLLVCFPSRSHLALLPAKPICSPARLSEPSKKLALRSGGGRQTSSPLLWSKSRTSAAISEPTSPKVTCAGQIKVRPGRPAASASSSCKNWQSVMQEIELLHKSQRYKRTSTALWFKKDVVQFLSFLRNLRFDFRCFGSAADITSDEDEDDEDAEDESNSKPNADQGECSETMFSKWFMVLQENQNQEPCSTEEEYGEIYNVNPPCGPPPNALLLMRCRSAPAKSWLEERQEEDRVNEENKKKGLVEMSYGNDFCKSASDIAKETWVAVEGIRDPLSRSRSWKR